VFEGGRIRITNEPVKPLIRAAFQLQNSQIAGQPEWVDMDRYDIETKTGRPERIGQGQMAPLLQSLLADRFHLKFHREMREMSVAALVTEKKGGQKLKVNTDGKDSGMNTNGWPTGSQVVGRLSRWRSWQIMWATAWAGS
jgi:uncharacterized protein (TIGR03435 family)